MGTRVYHAVFDGITISAAVDAFEITPADDKPVIIRKVVITPDSSETNQQIKVTIKRFSGAYTSGSGGSGGTVLKTDSHDAAHAFTLEVCNTTRATGGTAEIIQPESFPSQGGFEYLPDIDDRPKIYQGEAFVVGIEESPGVACSGYVVLQEI